FAVRTPRNDSNARSHALSRRVTSLSLRAFAVNLRQGGVINIGSESILNGFQVGLVTVCRELHAMRQAVCKVVHEMVSRARVTGADVPARNELRHGIHGNPRPNVTPAFGLLF